MKNRIKPPEKIWEQFQKTLILNDHQLTQFQQYQTFLSEQNKNINLTAITDLAAIVRQHFVDSLSIRDFLDIEKIKTIADVGSGAGFPAIPIKIMFPDISVILIEVNKKKQTFLSNLISILGFENVTICPLDWRTFLRKTTHPVDLFVTRAAIKEDELVRALKPSCFYNHCSIAYWVSEEWIPENKTSQFVNRIEHYKLGSRNRKLCFFSKKDNITESGKSSLQTSIDEESTI